MANIEISRIIIKRGPIWDLPGKPTSIEPINQSQVLTDDIITLLDIGTGQELFSTPTFLKGVFSKPLDEGELAFGTDEGRFFVGSNPDRGMRQSQRLAFPYQNVEIIGENSVDAFARVHGDRMREGDAMDYHTAGLPPTFGQWRALTFSGGETYDVIAPHANIFQHYTIHDERGRRIRHGVLTCQYVEGSPPDTLDEADVIRSDNYDPPVHDPYTVLGKLGFRYTAIGGGVRFEYRNANDNTYRILWRSSKA